MALGRDRMRVLLAVGEAEVLSSLASPFSVARLGASIEPSHGSASTSRGRGR